MRFILQRILVVIPLLLAISFIAFLLVRLAPGGPFDDARAVSPAVERNLQEKYNLNAPIAAQYIDFLGDLLKGDFGPSMKYRNHSVNDIILQGLPISLSLGFLAFGFALAVGIPLGFITAIRRDEWPDYAGSLAALISICIPGFILGPVLVMFLAVKWQWFPPALWETPRHVVLPVVTLGVYFAGRIARLMREGMTPLLNAPFIRTARAKGLSETAVWTRHGFRLAVLPVVSYSGPLLAELLTGSFVIENLFQIPGIGVFMVNSSLNRDYPMIVGLVLLYAVLLIGLNLIVDLAYGFMDPRVRNE